MQEASSSLLHEELLQLAGLRAPDELRVGELERLVSESGGAAAWQHLARALRGELIRFRLRICSAERALQDCVAPLPRARLMLGDDVLVMPALTRFAVAVREDNKAGMAALLDALFRAALSGVPCLRECFRGLLLRTHVFFVRCLDMWMTQGWLSSGSEFFVEERIYHVVTLLPGSPRGVTMLPSYAPELEWKTRFFIRYELVPMRVFSVALAEKVLFIGMANRLVFQGDSYLANVEGTDSAAQREDSASLTKELRRIIVDGLASSTKALDNINDINSVISSFYSRTAKRLFDILVNRERVLQRVQFVRDFFLLGRGDFYRTFLQACKKITTRRRGKMPQRAIDKEAWAQAASELFLGNEEDEAALYRNDFSSLTLGHLSSDEVYHNQNPIIWHSFLPADAEDRRQSLTLAGGAEMNEKEGGCISMCDQAAVWISSKQLIEEGFTTELSFDLTRDYEEDQPLLDAWVSFVIHHTTRYGTSLLYEQDATNGAIFSFHLTKGLLDVKSRDPTTKSEDTWMIRHTSKFKSVEREFKLKILYEFASTAPSLFTITMDGRKIASFHMNLGRVMSLERGSGRAWVGVMFKNISPSGDGKVERLNLRSWSFSIPKPIDVQETHLINLTWRRTWPLQLVFSDDSVERYNIIFRFLFLVMKIGDDLNGAWSSLSSPVFRMNKCKTLHTIWRLRASMSNLVDTLQFHLQVDIVDTLMNQLTDRLTKIKSFEEFVDAHNQFLQVLTTRCMIHNRVIRIGIHHVLSWSEQLCEIISEIARHQQDNTEGVNGWGPSDSTQELIDQYKTEIDTIAEGFIVDTTELCAAWDQVNPELAQRVGQISFARAGNRALLLPTHSKHS